MTPSRLGLLAVLALTATGCSGRSVAAPAVTTATPASTGTVAPARAVASPTATATVTQLSDAAILARPVAAAPARPVLPQATRINTTAGAKAVAAHFFTALDFARRTGDRGPLTDVSHPDCAWCTEQAAAGGVALDPLHRARVTDAFRFDESNVIVHVWHEYGHNARLRVDGRTTVVRPATERSTICLWWVDGRWWVGCASSGWLTPAQVRDDAARQDQEEDR